MIVFKQKEFNSAARKILNNKGIVDTVIRSKSKSLATSILSKYNKAKTSVLKGIEQTTGLPSLRGKIQKAENLSNPLEAAKRIGRKSVKAKSILNTVDQNPGKIVKDVAAKTAENPIAAFGTAGGWVPTVTSGVVVPGTTEAAAALELVAKKNPRYRNATKKLGKRIKEGKAGKILENGTNAVRRSIPLVLI